MTLKYPFFVLLFLSTVGGCGDASSGDGGIVDSSTDTLDADTGTGGETGPAVDSSIDARPDTAIDASIDAPLVDAPACSVPSTIVFETVPSQTRLDVGYNGTTHGLTVNEGTTFSVEVIGCDASCRRCQVRGPVRNPEGVVNQRCDNAVSTTCTTDSDCSDDGSCRYFMGGPFSYSLALGSFVTQSCVLIGFEPTDDPVDDSPIRGFVDLVGGGVTLTDFNMKVIINAGLQCDPCVGDTTPFDQVADGSCSGGPKDGVACDVAGISVTTAGSTSYDCQGDAASGFLQLALDLPVKNLGTSGETRSMGPRNPICTDPAEMGASCWCGACTDPEGLGCGSDLECAGSGTCDSTTFGMSMLPPTKQDTCDPAGPGCAVGTDGRGTCQAATGEMLACFPNDRLVADGMAREIGGQFFPRLGALVCFGATGDSAVDSVAGFPGPGRFEVQTRMTFR